MRKSVFVKYFVLITSAILVCLTVLSVLLVTFSASFWTEQQQERLTRNAVKVADTVSATITSAQLRFDPDALRYSLEMNSMNTPGELRSAIGMMSFSSDCDIWITDQSGVANLVSVTDSDIDFSNITEIRLPQSLVNKALVKNVFEVSFLGKPTEGMSYTAGCPIYYYNYDGTARAVVGAAFVSTPADNLSDYLFEIIRMVFYAFLLALLFSLVGTYIVTYQLARPIRQMVAAAKRFAEGDFSQPIPVNSSDEIAGLAIELNHMAASLASLEGMRRSFVANVSHELRTPMTTIAGFIDGILDGTIPPERQPEYLQTVSDEVKRLSRLVQAMLDISRMEAGELKLNKSEFDLSQTVLRVFFSCEKLIEDKRLNIEGFDGIEPTPVLADSDRIHQVIFNLVDNAIKFTPVGGTIRVQMRQEGGYAFFTLRNTGAGIEPGDLSRIFDRFYKSDKSRSLDKKGVGLGLFIVRMLIQLHGGDIVARSVQGEYAEFEFWLPMPPAELPQKSDRHFSRS